MFTRHSQFIAEMQFTSNDKRMVSSSEDGLLYEWDIETGACLSEFFLRHCCCSVICLKDVSMVAFFEEIEDKSTTVATRRQSRNNVKRQNSPTKCQRRLCFWNNGMSNTPDTTIEIGSVRVSSIAMSEIGLHNFRQQVVIIGYEDGSILLSMLPIPLLKIETASATLTFVPISISLENEGSADSSTEDYSPSAPLRFTIDESKCKLLHAHKGPVDALQVSSCGEWMFSGGRDGAIFMFSTNYKAMTSKFIVDSGPVENSLALTDINAFRVLKQDAKVRKIEMDEMAADSQRNIDQIRFDKDEIILDLEKRLFRDVTKRDKIIVSERESHLRSLTQLHHEIEDIKVEQRIEGGAIEHAYELKLAQESTYLFQC
jgi:WD40 repeat protein